jgi:hypothetical protein
LDALCGDLDEETGALNCMVFFFGLFLAVWVAVVPLSADHAPEQVDEFLGPDVACVMAAVEFEFCVVVLQESFLEPAPIFDQTTLEELGPAGACLELMEFAKGKIIGSVLVVQLGVSSFIDVAAQCFQQSRTSALFFAAGSCTE